MKRILILGVALLSAALAIQLVPAGRDASAATATVSLGDNFYNPATVTINVGDTVQWNWTGANPHTVTATGGEFDSGSPMTSGTFSHTFATAGTFNYQCKVHGTAMTGVVTVQQAGAATSAAGAATPAATSAAGAGLTPAAGATSNAATTPAARATTPALPTTGTGSSGGGSTAWMVLALGAAGLAAVATSAGLAIRRRR